MNRQQIMIEWMDKNNMTRTMLAKKIGCSVSIICAALRINCDENKSYSKFWESAQQFTGLDLGVVISKKQEVSKSKVKLPEYIESTLRFKRKTVINNKLLKKYGEKRIIEYFQSKGLNIKITHVEGDNKQMFDYLEVV